ncbi:ABC transporter permease [Mesorhizobium sp.]|uniref:ABC transporter permease n=1 Tax=Mesorhizobium sp. TaxID=1871066 RepID=UPI0025CEBA7D|nr:ABC transporter permease [Mesorhizobium sp.]
MSSKPFDWKATPGLRTLSWVVYLFLYAPLLVIIIYSFNAGRQATLWEGFSLDWYARVFHNRDIGIALSNSLIVAVASMILSTMLAVTAALGLRHARTGGGGQVTLGLILMPLVVPEIVVAVATLVFFSGIGLKLGLGNLIIAHTVFCVPFAYLPIQARLTDMGSAVEDAARDLYSNEWQVFRRVTLPLLLPAILSGAMLAFASSLDDFLISMLLADAGQTTLPVYIYGMLRLGVSPEINAVSTLLLGSSVVIVLVALRMQGMTKRRN